MKTILSTLILLAGIMIMPQQITSGTIQSAESFDDLLVSYLQIKNNLVASQSAQVQAQEFLQKAKAINLKTLSGEKLNVWQTNSASIIKDLEGMATTTDLEKQRKYFAELSVHFYPVVKKAVVKRPLYYQFCPMYNNNKGAYWISEQSKIQNPYYGKKMLTCGSTKETLI